MNKRHISGRLVLASGLVAASLFGLFESGVVKVQVHPPLPAAALADNQQQIHQELGTFARLARELKPSVVNIAVEKVVNRSSEGPSEILRQFFPNIELPQQQQAPSKMHGQGSGVIISSDGYIVTNNHVVSDADEVLVTLSTGQEFQARVIGTDPKTDLALVKVTSPTSLPAAALGDSDRLEVGEWVMAIGNPFGLEATVTVGVLSGKGRVISQGGMYDDFLQTDASINPGNSGGPLFNTDGQVVGINTAIIGQGIGFAIPVNLTKGIVRQLKDKGRVVRGYLGLGIQPLTPRLKHALALPAEAHGALVSEVVPKAPGAIAGAHVEDIITEINGHPVSNDRELLSQVAMTPIGSTAALTILRGGRQQSLNVLITERPDDEATKQAAEAPVLRHSSGFGLEVEPITAEIADELGTLNTKGVVVVNVATDSPADRAGLRRGDIVRRVGDTPIGGTQDFLSALSRNKHDGQVALLVESPMRGARGGITHFRVLDTN
jgi:serine protease Do